jgi:hypothetical protein
VGTAALGKRLLEQVFVNTPVFHDKQQLIRIIGKDGNILKRIIPDNQERSAIVPGFITPGSPSQLYRGPDMRSVSPPFEVACRRISTAGKKREISNRKYPSASVP